MTAMTDIGLDSVLDAYRAGGAFFSSATGSMLGTGVAAEISGGDHLARRVQGLLDDSDQYHPVVIGALAFDPAGPSRFVVPEQVLRGGPLPNSSAPAASPMRWSHVRAVPEPHDYADGVRSAVKRIRAGELSKVVLARSLEVSAADTVDPADIVRRLARRDPRGYTFALDVAGRSLVGASPELLVRKRGHSVVSNPLAGSAARSSNPIEDERRSRALLSSAKDRAEHAWVVEAVATALQPFCVGLDVPPEPVLIKTATMWHLSTKVEGFLSDASTSVLDLATALHPTPAVCGTPVDLARSVIAETEPFDRRLYTGAVGWCDSAGDGEWVVTIRCAEVDGDTIRLFAGAGIVSESDPESELAETSAKFRTLLLAMGIGTEEKETDTVASGLTLERVREDIAEVLSAELSTLDNEDNLLDLGLDSIRIMTLAERWRQAGAEASFVELAERPTVAQWWALLSSR